MRRNWFAGVEALHTIVRVLPSELYDQVVSGKGDIPPGASVPGGGPGKMPMKKGKRHQHGNKKRPKKKSGNQHQHHHQ
jgi:hypothetical protein